MAVEFKNSKTKDNLMRAFAGESQARNRYTFAASQAKKQNLYVVGAVFEYTADQEKSHAKVFYQQLKELSGETIFIDGGYPVDLSDDVTELLKSARHNEYEEYDSVYKAFGAVAKEEGFEKASAAFQMISEIEKIHGDRFGRLAEFLEKNELFVSAVETSWMCLNCGHFFSGTQVPEKCPVCDHPKGYFIRFELSPYEGKING